MKYDPSRKLRWLSMAAGLLILAAIPCKADDCAKAREFYKSGAAEVNYRERAAAFQEAIRLCPAYAEAHVNLADAYEHLAALNHSDATEFNRTLDLAIAHYREALRLNDRLFPAYLGLGDTLRVVGLYEQSKKAYTTALGLRPGHPKAASGLARIRAIQASDRDGLKQADEIVGRLKASTSEKGPGNLMGFANRTVVKDRIRFTNILFDEWSYELNREETLQQLEEIGKALATPELQGCRFVVEGHTDNLGGLERNQALSEDRADAVKQFLVDRYGIDTNLVQTQGLGYSRPRAPNDTPDNRLKNRRVELLFVQE